MKVLLIHLSDYHRGGGGGIAMQGLHLALKRAGIDSKILCGIKTGQTSDIFEIPRIRKWERLLQLVTSNLGLNDIHRLGSFKVKNLDIYAEADVINFHGIHSGTLSYLALPQLTQEKPALFTLHDMWALTGHCGYSFDCERWKIGCGQCPYPKENPAIRRDGTRLEWKLKDWAYRRSNLTFVAPSRWLTEQARQSMLGRYPIYHIPNGINTQIYKPLGSALCRRLLGIPANKKVLMFAAQNLRSDRKGGDLLLKAIQRLPKSLLSEVVLLTFGNAHTSITEMVDIPTRHLGYVNSDYVKAIAYSAADIFIHPTRADNLPLVLQESMACGTPLVSFNIGGVADLVRPGLTGYLARAEDVQDLCDGIVQLLEDERRHTVMRRQCRTIAVKEYSIELQTQRYMKLYYQLAQKDVTSTSQNPLSKAEIVKEI